MIVNLEELAAMQKRRIEISSTPIEQIEFYLNGKLFPIEKETIRELKYSGLSPINIIDFLSLEPETAEFRAFSYDCQYNLPAPIKPAPTSHCLRDNCECNETNCSLWEAYQKII